MYFINSSLFSHSLLLVSTPHMSYSISSSGLLDCKNGCMEEIGKMALKPFLNAYI